MKILGELNICGATYMVKTGSAADLPMLENAHGVCISATRTIWIDDAIGSEHMLDTLSHEVLHALLNESGVLQATEAAFDADLPPRWEESIVRILAPHMASAFGPPQLQKVKRAGRRQ